jgi:hypothetical protein
MAVPVRREAPETKESPVRPAAHAAVPAEFLLYSFRILGDT